MSTNLIDIVKSAGIVGAGGATFPTHVKINATVDTVIVNGAECEPLLRVDQQLMDVRAADMLAALQAVMDHTKASKGIVGLKKKYVPAINSLRKELVNYPQIELGIMDNFYPAGDEQTLVYEMTGRIVPEGGIPLNVGTLVINVETLLNIYDMMTNEKPVIDKYITFTNHSSGTNYTARIAASDTLMKDGEVYELDSNGGFYYEGEYYYSEFDYDAQCNEHWDIGTHTLKGY